MNIFSRHFIHLYFLAEFEVLFYIYYIMPYEKKLIYGIFKIQKMIDDIPIGYIPIQNITKMFSSKCDGYDHEFDSYNNKLINKCTYFIWFLNTILGGIVIHDLAWMYRKYNAIPASPKRRTMRKLSSFGSSEDMKKYDEQIDSDTALINNEDNFIKYYWKNSEVVSEIVKTVQFIIIVGAFEYLFFTNIVNKYKIVNSKTLICKMIDELR